MKSFSVTQQADLFSNQAVSKVSFIDWNGNPQELPTRPDKTAEQVKNRYILFNSLELIRKLVKQRENNYNNSLKYNFDFTATKICLEKLNDKLLQFSLYDERHFRSFVIEVTEQVIPALEAIQPGQKSRFYVNYKLNINRLRAFFFNELKRIELF